MAYRHHENSFFLLFTQQFLSVVSYRPTADLALQKSWKALFDEAHSLSLVVLISIVHHKPKSVHQEPKNHSFSVVSCRPAAGLALQMS